MIKQIHVNRQQEAFLRTVQGLVESKEAEIEKICADNYQDFIQSVSTLSTIKSYTNNLRYKIETLDLSVTQVGRGLIEKKKALLQSKKTAANLDEAIDGLQACLKVLDVVNRVGQMIKEEKYWSALRVSDYFTIRRNKSDIYSEIIPVTRGSADYAPSIPISDPVIPTSHVLFTFPSRTNQGCRYRIHETMVTRDPK